MVSQAELILRVITLWFLVLSQIFRDGVGLFNVYFQHVIICWVNVKPYFCDYVTFATYAVLSANKGNLKNLF